MASPVQHTGGSTNTEGWPAASTVAYDAGVEGGAGAGGKDGGIGQGNLVGHRSLELPRRAARAVERMTQQTFPRFQFSLAATPPPQI